jgi:cyclase
MLPPRIVVCLLLRNQGLVKTVRFKDPKYIGDPINAVRIFNEKEVDELVFLDITATRERRRPPFELLERITTECFMPLCYGGGVRTIGDVKRLVGLGVEKVAINTYAVQRPAFIREAADLCGSSSVIASIDVMKTLFGRYVVVTHGGTRKTGLDPVQFAIEMERQGAGEIILNSVDRDGTMSGYDLELVRRVSTAVGIPVVACGGAGSLDDLRSAVVEGHASAAAAGSMFVYHGRHRAVLITYPSAPQIKKLFPPPMASPA